MRLELVPEDLDETFDAVDFEDFILLFGVAVLLQERKQNQ